jgi:transposase
VIEKALYARRNAVERLIGWLPPLINGGEHRSLATRFDKLAASFLAMVKLACVRRLLRALFSDRA